MRKPPTIQKISYFNNISSHLRSGIYCGISAGFILACLESIFLLFRVGNFFMDFLYFIKAVLIYGLAGGLSGFIGSALFYLLFFRKKEWPNSKVGAFYFSLFLGAGIFFELFFYLMDIYPFGGHNKFSLRTLSLVAASALFSVVITFVINCLLRRVLARRFFIAFSRKLKIYREIAVLIILLFCFLIFSGLKGLNSKIEKKTADYKKGLSFPYNYSSGLQMDRSLC